MATAYNGAKPQVVAPTVYFRVARNYGINGLERLTRLYAAWDGGTSTAGHAAQAAEWNRKLAEFDRSNADAKPAGAEPADAEP